MVIIKVEFEEEAITSETRQVYRAPSWMVTLVTTKSKALLTKIQKLLDARKDWQTPLYTTFVGKMVYREKKGEPFDVTTLFYEDSLLAIMQAWKDRMKLREEPKQRSLVEKSFDMPLAKKAKRKEIKIVRRRK